MAQGSGKLKGQGKQGSGGRKKTGTMRKGRMEIAPKHAQKVAEKSQKKVSPMLRAGTRSRPKSGLQDVYDCSLIYSLMAG